MQHISGVEKSSESADASTPFWDLFGANPCRGRSVVRIEKGCLQKVRAPTPAKANFYHFLRGSLFVLTASGTQKGNGSGGSRRVCVGKESKADSTPHCKLHQIDSERTKTKLCTFKPIDIQMLNHLYVMHWGINPETPLYTFIYFLINILCARSKKNIHNSLSLFTVQYTEITY